MSRKCHKKHRKTSCDQVMHDTRQFEAFEPDSGRLSGHVAVQKRF